MQRLQVAAPPRAMSFSPVPEALDHAHAAAAPDVDASFPHARSLHLCNRSWLRVLRDSATMLKPPAASVSALSHSQVDRARAFAQVRSAGQTFEHNGFLWRKPKASTDTQLRQHYAMMVREPGVRAGYIELCAVAEALEITITLWDVKRSWTPKGRGQGQFLGMFGVDGAAAPHIDIGVIDETHFRALVPHEHKRSYHETEAGGMGECLFLSVRQGLQRHRGALAELSAAQLRGIAADRIFADARFDGRVRAVSEQAAFEHALPGFWQDMRRRVRAWTTR